ncbi:MAG: hypothetical protein QM660_09090 [Dysgonomonas sp.]
MNIENLIKNQEEMRKALIGANGYSITNKYIELPTDTSILTGRIFAYYDMSKDESCLESFREGILNLLINKNTLYLVPYYLGSYLFQSKQYKIDSTYFFHQIVSELNKAILSNEDYLKNNKEGTGWQYKNGQLEDIKRNIKNIETEFYLTD